MPLQSAFDWRSKQLTTSLCMCVAPASVTAECFLQYSLLLFRRLCPDIRQLLDDVGDCPVSAWWSVEKVMEILGRWNERCCVEWNIQHCCVHLINAWRHVGTALVTCTKTVAEYCSNDQHEGFLKSLQQTNITT